MALIDISTLSFSWNDTLLNGETVDRFYIYERGSNYNEVSRIAIVTDNSWVMQDISRDTVYFFSVSAVTTSGDETRRSSEVYIDPPPLPGDIDGGDRRYQLVFREPGSGQ